MSRRFTSILAAALLLMAGCSGSAEPGTLRLMTHDSFAVSDEVLAEFRESTGAQVEILRSGDAAVMLNQAILSRETPLADVIFGIDNTYLSRALDADILLPYDSPAADVVPDELRPDAGDRVTPIDHGAVCLNYDRDAFADTGLAAPRTLEDLVRPEYAGMLTVQNPATSSPGLAFMLATIVRFGESGDYTWLDYWRDLRNNDVEVTAGWEEAYYGSFSGGTGEGDRPIVVSYASSPPVEVYLADPQPEQAPTAVIEDGCFRQVEYAGILRGTPAEPLARRFIDFMLSRPFQEDIPLSMFVLPASREAELPQVFVDHATQPSAPLEMEPSVIGQNRDRWLNEWTEAVLR